MAKKIDAELVLELLGRGMTGREIQKTRHIAQQSVKEVREAAEEKGVAWVDVERMDGDEVYDLLFPDQAQAKAATANVDVDYVHSELQKTGVTLKLLHGEYCDQAGSEGLAVESYTSLCRDCSEYVIARNVTNRLEHKPGQVMEVDWSGASMRLENPGTLERAKACLFVACLPYSQCSCVEATLDMRQSTWLKCHVNAYGFFGGVPVRTVCDNLKTGVIKHPRRRLLHRRG